MMGQLDLFTARAQGRAPDPRHGNPLPPVVGLPEEEQRLLDALGGLIGHEYVITLASTDQVRRIADAVRMAVRNDFTRRVEAEQVDPVERAPLDAALAMAMQPLAPKPARHPVPELAALSAEIASGLEEAARITRGMEADFLPAGGGAWAVFLAPPGRVGPPLLLREAASRFDAEYQASRATGIAEVECFAVPAARLPEGLAVELAEHPLRLPEGSPPADLADAFTAAMERELRRSDEGMAAQMRATATFLGCTVPELEAKLESTRQEQEREKADRKAAKPPRLARRAPRAAPDAHPVDAGQRRLSDRQRELLALVDVDQGSNRVVYTRDEHVPDWPELKIAVEALGGVWRSKGKKTPGGWIFPEGIDAMDAVRHALTTGAIFDPKLLGLFPTPDWLADALVAKLDLRPGDRVLEPSGGLGALALAVRRACPAATVVCVELVAEHQAALRQLGFEVIGGDFMTKTPEDLGGLFDIVVANPPFGQGRPELHHLRHMLGFLRGAGSWLGAIMPASLKFRHDPITVEVRGLLDVHGACYDENPDDAFREAGAGVRTLTVTMRRA